jgi:glycine betaine transporter
VEDPGQPGAGGTSHRHLFLPALLLSALFAGTGIVEPALFARAGQAVTHAVFGAVDWLLLLVVLAFLLLVVALAASRYGRLVLGRPGERPEFTRASWIAMLFAAGMGTGLVFWGVAEPLVHLGGAPGAAARTDGAAARALVLTNFHWGLHAWGIYALAALVIAYFGFRHGTVHLPGAPLRHALPARLVRPLAAGADFLAVLAIVFGVAGSIGMGTFQIRSGLHRVAGTGAGSRCVALVIVAALVAAYLSSALSGLNRGIKWLSNANVLLAIGLALFVLLAGPTPELLSGMLRDAGAYLVELLPLSVRLYDTPGEKQWFHSWTLTNFVWWIAWAPFVGVFVARISRGRTLREFVLGVLVAPTAFSLAWFSILGGSGLRSELGGPGGLAALATGDASRALFGLLGQLPAPALTSGLAIVLVFLFLVTSVDSATFVLAMLSDGGSSDPPLGKRISWGLALGALGGGMALSDRIEAVRSLSVVGAIPYTLVMVLQAVSLVRALRRDS